MTEYWHTACISVTDMVIAEQNWQPMIDAIWENRTVEDYEATNSTVKTDFMRKWHHNRSGKPISLDEMMENEDGDIFEVADPRGEFEQKVISEMQIAAFAEQSISEKDREILKLRMDGLTEQEIAGKVGYKTASAIHKRIAKIAEAYDMLSQTYEAEQKQLEAEAITLQQEIEVQERQNENIEKSIQKAHKYVGIEELDGYALRELVSAIYVDAPDKSSGKRVQHIHIKYDGLGFIPLNELMKKETA